MIMKKKIKIKDNPHPENHIYSLLKCSEIILVSKLAVIAIEKITTVIIVSRVRPRYTPNMQKLLHYLLSGEELTLVLQ